MAERVVHRQEVPRLAPGLGQRRSGAGRRGVGVKHPVEAGGTAILIGQPRGGGAGEQADGALFLQQLLHRQRSGRIGQVCERVHTVAVQPLAGLGRSDVGLVLVVGRQHLDLHAAAFGLQAVFNGEVGGHHRALAAEAGVRAGHVRQDADLDDAVGNLRVGACGQSQTQGQRNCCEAERLLHHFCLLFCLIESEWLSEY